MVHSSRNYDFSGLERCIDKQIPLSIQKRLNTDYVMLVTTMEVSQGTAASCGYCMQAQSNKRPIMGVISVNVNIFNYLTVHLIKDFEFMVQVLLHEILHGLGWGLESTGSFQDLNSNSTDKTIPGSQVIRETFRRGKKVLEIILPGVVATA